MTENVAPPGQDIAQVVAAAQSAARESSEEARQRAGMISDLTVDVRSEAFANMVSC